MFYFQLWEVYDESINLRATSGVVTMTEAGGYIDSYKLEW